MNFITEVVATDRFHCISYVLQCIALFSRNQINISIEYLSKISSCPIRTRVKIYTVDLWYMVDISEERVFRKVGVFKLCGSCLQTDDSQRRGIPTPDLLIEPSMIFDA